MKRLIGTAALSLLLAVALSSSVSLAAVKKQKPSAEHVAAIKKCNEEYQAAVKDARMKKGKDRKDALAAARKGRTDCRKNAPK